MDGQTVNNSSEQTFSSKPLSPISEALPDNMDGPSTSQTPDKQPAVSRNRLKAYLANMEVCVEKLRNEAMLLVEKRDTFLLSMDLLKCNDKDLKLLTTADRDEIAATKERMAARLDTIQLNVLTVRSTAQKLALQHVIAQINEILGLPDLVRARRICQKYLNTCQYARQIGDIFVDVGFDDAWRACTVDDQQKIKMRLVNLMGYYSTAN